MSDKLCSVVIPAYNCGKHLANAIQSVLLQNFQEIEIIVVDDCSTDNCQQIVTSFSCQYPCIRYIKHERNMGVAQARNTGVANAKGRWIAFLDADDVWYPNKLETQIQAVQAQNRALCYTGAVFYDEGKGRSKEIQVPTEVTERQLRFGNVIITSSVLVLREVLLRYPMERSDLHEDYITWLRILKEQGPGVGINQPLTGHLVGEKTKSGNKLKSAVMTFKTYRFMGYHYGQCIRYFFSYINHGMRRYQ